MAFNIGDFVSWQLHSEADKPNRYEIIGSKETPYDEQDRASSPFHQPITVTAGNDYILRPLFEDGKFHAFRHAREQHLALIETGS